MRAENLRFVIVPGTRCQNPAECCFQGIHKVPIAPSESMGHSIPILLQRDRFKFIVQVGNPSRLRGDLVSTAANSARRGYPQGTIVQDDLRRSNKQARK